MVLSVVNHFFFSLVSSDSVYFIILATVLVSNIFYSLSACRFKFSSRAFYIPPPYKFYFPVTSSRVHMFTILYFPVHVFCSLPVYSFAVPVHIFYRVHLLVILYFPVTHYKVRFSITCPVFTTNTFYDLSTYGLLFSGHVSCSPPDFLFRISSYVMLYIPPSDITHCTYKSTRVP